MEEFRKLKGIPYLDENTGEVFHFDVYSSGENIWKQMVPVKDALVGDYINIDLIVGGWPYETIHINPPERFIQGVPYSAYRRNHALLMVVVDVGFVDFISSRDAIDTTPRSRRFIQKLKEELNDKWAKGVISDLSIDDQLELALWFSITTGGGNIFDTGYRPLQEKEILEFHEKLALLSNAPPIKTEFAISFSRRYDAEKYIVGSSLAPFIYQRFPVQMFQFSNLPSVLQAAEPFEVDLNFIFRTAIENPNVIVICNFDYKKHIKKFISKLNTIKEKIKGVGKSLVIGFAKGEVDFWKDNPDYANVRRLFHFLDMEDILESVKPIAPAKSSKQGGVKPALKKPKINHEKITWHEVFLKEKQDILVRYDFSTMRTPPPANLTEDDKGIVVLLFNIDKGYVPRPSFSRVVFALVDKYGYDKLKTKKIYIVHFLTNLVTEAIELNDYLINLYSSFDVYSSREYNNFDCRPTASKLKVNDLPKVFFPHSLLSDENREGAELQIFVYPILRSFVAFLGKELSFNTLRHFQAYQSKAFVLNHFLETFDDDFEMLFKENKERRLQEAYLEVYNTILPITQRRREIAFHFNYRDDFFAEDMLEEDKDTHAGLLSKLFQKKGLPEYFIGQEEKAEEK